ncbi:hypothetical protein [Pelosinus sp. sgz500959]|uniref:hypothetical protein n=1 Tax=Pelosinus sp. sgz500959 TaxID=3242472 RepID=UPI00366F9AA8
MAHKIVVFILLLGVMLSGCGTRLPVPIAGLTVLTANEEKQWSIPEHLIEQGDGNSYRVVKATDQNNSMLELVAGNQGQLEYFIEEEADIAAFAELRLQFLSTQGRGRIKLSALDRQGKIIGETGFVFTGELPKSSMLNKWQDTRYITNFQGNWIEKKQNFSEMLATLPQEQLRSAVKYRLSVEVGQGQHALITKFIIGSDPNKAMRLIPTALHQRVGQGDRFVIEADAQNMTSKPMDHIAVKMIEPYGYGLVSMDQSLQTIDHLNPGEKHHISWQLQAKRPDAVNLNKPWTIKFSVNDQEVQEQVQVSVSDPNPGKIFYVMTEDLEPIDGAGYPTAWGNRNSWLEPQEFLGQMVGKSEALNGIAEKYGAKWTHYIAWPAVKAAQWAGGQSKTGQWPKIVSAIQESVVQEAGRGHEYGIHLHSDYDPYLPGNVLSYNEAVDGIWANHLKHGWAHSVFTEGDFSDYTSRTGMLYDYQSILDQLARNSDQGQLLTARVGSFDFGSGKADEAMSTNAYKKVGLWGSSDADGNNGGAVTTGDYGHEIYFTAPDDINGPAEDLSKVGIVEFRPTPRQSISYNDQSAMVMNQKTDQGMEYFTAGSRVVKPGIHAVIGFTHAMFVMGDGDWKSLEGGQFQAIDEHLAYVKQKYVDQGVLNFGTASELVEAYLDYYTPQLLAIYGKRLSDERGIAEYAIRIVGRDILVDEQHNHIVNIKYPLYLRESAYRISILKNGQPIYTTWGLPTPFNDIRFVVDDKEAVYTMKIYHNEFAFRMLTRLHGIKMRISQLFK